MRVKTLAAALLTAALLQAPGRATAAPPSEDKIAVSRAELKRLGVNPQEVTFGLVSEDGTLGVASNKETRAREIAKGKIQWIHFFKLDWATHKTTCRSVCLPLAFLDNYTLHPDGKTLIVVGGHGTKVLAVDSDTLTYRTVYEYKPGQVGFRINPVVLWPEKDTVCTRGYALTKNQEAGAPCVVSIDPKATGINAFKVQLNARNLFVKYKELGTEIWYSSHQAYVSLHGSGANFNSLYMYNGDANHLQLVDSTRLFDSMAVGRDRVFYAAHDANNAKRLVVADVATNEKFKVGDGKSNYTYTYLSSDGKTILASLLDLEKGRHMTTWYGHEADGFALHPMPGMTDVSPGTIRMARSGKVLAQYNIEGVAFRKIP
jgi:hypothetical protein